MTTILLIDDEPLILDFMTKALERAGYSILAESDGVAGIDCFQRENVDLVITDLVMPEKEGIQTIRELLAIRPDLKIIAISGGGVVPSDLYLGIAEKFGAKKVLNKPFLHNELLFAVQEVLNS